MSTNLGHFEQYLNGSVSSDPFADTGHGWSISYSTLQYTNSFFIIFESISCVKSVLKRVKDKTIKNSTGLKVCPLCPVCPPLLRKGRKEEVKA